MRPHIQTIAVSLASAVAAVASLHPAKIHASPADESTTRVVVIRSYDTFGVTDGTLRSAQVVAQEVLTRAGIELLWRACRTPAHPVAPDRCDDILGPEEIIIRILHGPAVRRRSAPVGESCVEGRDGFGVLATIFADRILSVAARAAANAHVVLGRAIAHELGHLLIGTPRHSPTGLMRPRWSDAELRRNREQDWLFSPRQGEQMRARLRVRRADRLLSGVVLRQYAGQEVDDQISLVVSKP